MFSTCDPKLLLMATRPSAAGRRRVEINSLLLYSTHFAVSFHNDEVHLILTMARKLAPGGEQDQFAKPNCCRGRVLRSYNVYENSIIKRLFALGSRLGKSSS